MDEGESMIRVIRDYRMTNYLNGVEEISLPKNAIIRKIIMDHHFRVPIFLIEFDPKVKSTEKRQFKFVRNKPFDSTHLHYIDTISYGCEIYIYEYKQ